MRTMKDVALCSENNVSSEERKVCENSANEIEESVTVGAFLTSEKESEEKKNRKRKKKSRKSDLASQKDCSSGGSSKKVGNGDSANGNEGASFVEKENTNVNVTSPKMDAFQFMMNSRHKSIGRNSPGREIDDSDDFTGNVPVKKQMQGRKKMLESWAEAKGALKRKREYEEIGNCIDRKLVKRGEKLKKMLKIECHSDDEVITKKKRCAVLESDSENSNDVVFMEVESEKKCSVKRNRRVRNGRNVRLSLHKKDDDLDCDDCEEGKLTKKSVKMWKFKIKLNMEENSKKEEFSGDENDDASQVQGEGTLSETVQSETVSESQNEIVIEDTALGGSEKTNVTNVIESEITSSQNGVTIEECEKDLNSSRRVLRARRSQPKMYEEYVLSDLDEDEKKPSKNNKREKKKIVKVAPVFLKAKPKPKLDPEVVEARRQFLMSGIPSSLKKEMERQQCNEEIDFDVFPTVSHVQQISPNNVFWNLPKTELIIKDLEPVKMEFDYLGTKLFATESSDQMSWKEIDIPDRMKNCKKIIRVIKSQNPNYPVYRIFKTVYNKSGYRVKRVEAEEKKEERKSPSKRRGRKKKNSLDKNVEVVASVGTKVDESLNVHAMWTEKYKPKASTEVVGNHSAVSSLKEWLTNWLNMTKNVRTKKNCSDDESDFDITDSDSRDSTRTNGNTVIVRGPTGSGKTAAVYAVCNELGFNILEVNASSKRTGKRLLQELQEATQSHQVRKKGNLLSFAKEVKKEEPSNPKMCVLLVEDVDVVFEQDEGFSAALSQIIATSKRPIILTTTDEPSSGVQKVISDHHTISFAPLPSILSTWLQIVCLVEGCYVHEDSLDELLSYNRGDIRRTLLQLQLWVSSGGQPYKTEKVESFTDADLDKEVKTEDDISNISDLRLDARNESDEDVMVHYDCISCGRVMKKYKSFSLPQCNNFEVIWWNLPTILNLPNYSNVRLDRNNSCDSPQSTTRSEKSKLNSLCDVYDSLAFADVISDKSQFHESLERRWRTKPKNGLGLEENTSDYTDHEFRDDLGHTLLSGRIKLYKEKYEETSSGISISVPEPAERRWRSKQISGDERLQSALLQSDLLARKSLALDYMPVLRTIARSESERAAINTKRGNRFYNYLKNLSVSGGETTYKLACDVFRDFK